MVQKSKNLLLFLSVMAMTHFAWVADAFALNGDGGGDGAGQGQGGTGSECANDTIGGVINCLRANTADYLIGAFTGASYLMGLMFGVAAILKLKDHVENPNNTPFSAAAKRFIAGGALFALPYMRFVLENTITNDYGINDAEYANTGFNGEASEGGLDAMIVSMMQDVFMPLQYVFGTFGYVAGILLTIIGISRLLKTEQDGPRGPAGIGTIITFLTAGLLFSLNTLMARLTSTMFENSVFQTNGTLQYTDGLGDSAAHVHAVISAIIAFGIIIGWVSIIRGLFIIRGVSEGGGNASMMAAITHLIGGVLALNLGSVIMAVQNTLGITQYGIIFN